MNTGNGLDFINEFSDDIELDDYDRKKVVKLYEAIFKMQTKINEEWFLIPENKEYYLSQCKAIIGK